MSVVPDIPRCSVDLRTVGTDIVMSAACPRKNLRWAAHLHGGKEHKQGWVIPPHQVYDLIAWLTAQGCRVHTDPGLASLLRVSGDAYRILYTPAQEHPRWTDMYPFQRDAAQYLMVRRRALLLDEMGLGKTVSALMALHHTSATLVVCPANLRLNWHRECQQWRPDLTPIVPKGPPVTVPYRFGEVCIVSPEYLTQWYGHADTPMLPDGFNHLIVDEAHYFKNKKAKRTQALMVFASAVPFVWGLTGTIMANSPVDVQGVLRTFGLFHQAFCTSHFFAMQYGMQRDVRTGIITWPKSPEHADKVAESLGRVSLRRTRAEVLPELPAKTWGEIVVDITSQPTVEIPDTTHEIERVYKALDKSGTKVVPADWTVISRTRALVAEAKIPFMLDFVARFVESETPLVVASFSVAPLKSLADLGHPVIMGLISTANRHKFVKDFQDGKGLIIGIQLEAGGTGITLTRANHMLMVQRDWTPDKNKQAEDRICRIGQTKPVVIYDLWANHPIDQRISRAVRDKQTRVQATVGRIKNRVLYGEDLISEMKTLADIIDKRNEQPKTNLGG